MSHLTDKVSYIRGLMEGMQWDGESNEGKLLGQLVALVGEMAEEMETMSAVVDELSEYVEDIDEDLGEVEESLGFTEDGSDEEPDPYDDDEDFDDYDDEDDEDDEDDGDGDDDFDDEDGDDPDNVYVECMCPKCRSTFYVLESELGEGVFHICPRCKEKIHVQPDYEDEVPIAHLAEDEPQE